MTSIKIVDENFGKELWNDKAKHPLQSWEWGNVRSSAGIKILRLAEYQGELLVKVYLVILDKLPKVNLFTGYLGMCDQPSPELIQFLQEYGKRNKVISFKFEPDIFIGTQEAKIFKEIILRNMAFKESSLPIFHAWTYIVDLNKSEEELLKNLKQKTRYNVRLATKKGVEVKEVKTDEGFKDFVDLYAETCQRQSYNGPGYTYHYNVWLHTRDSMSKILIAYLDNVPLAAYELFCFNGMLYYPYGGTSDKHREVMAPSLLMWEAILLGKRLGLTAFDMWGINPPGDNAESGWGGFSRFKEGYSGEHKQLLGSFDYVINKPAYYLYTLAFALKERLKK